MNTSHAAAAACAVAILASAGLRAGMQGPSDPASYISISTATPPNQIAGAALCPLPDRGALLFGGETSNGYFYATYEWDGEDWTKQYSTLNPSGRRGHALTFDPVRRTCVMFGGANPGGSPMGDTWTYSQGAWTIRQPSRSPAARQGHAMVFDAATGRVLLFGGQNAAGNALSDTWEWDGSNWTQRSPLGRPSGRRGHVMVWDPIRQRAVLFGGISGSIYLDDVWEWDGSNWALRSPATTGWGPAARTGCAAAFDPRSERVVIHGGENSIGCLSDMWTWDGLDWTQHPTSGTAPSSRTGHGIYYDSARTELRMFGGRCGSTYSDETWKIDLPVYGRATNFGAGCAGSIGVPVINAAPGSRPITGQAFTVELTNLPNSLAAVAFMLVGFTKDFWAGGPLPLDLTIVGMPGCSLLTSSEETVTLPNIGGRASQTLTIPNESALYGASLYFQGAVFDRPANSQGVILSPGLDARIGDR